MNTEVWGHNYNNEPAYTSGIFLRMKINEGPTEAKFKHGVDRPTVWDEERPRKAKSCY
jgi:hypothetical protein